MQPYLLSPAERVRHWREFRLSFSEIETDMEQLVKTMKYWQRFPIMDHLLDVDFPKDWPTPWELIMDGNFCPTCLAYLMEQTLLMSDSRWVGDRLQLMYIHDRSNFVMLMILVIDNKYMINYTYDTIIDFDFIIENCIILHKYQVKDRIHFVL